MDEKCFCHFNGYQVKDATARKAIDSILKVINGIRRKVNAHSGSIQRIDEEVETGRCTNYSVDENGLYTEWLLGKDDAARRIRINTDPGSISLFEINRLSGYGIRQNSLYSSKTNDKTLIGVWIDGVKHDSIEVLKNDALSFKTLMIIYKVNAGTHTINTCLTVNASGFRVYESVPEEVEENPLIKQTIESNYATHLYTPTQNHAVFIINNNMKFMYVEKVEDMGNTVVKMIDFNGGM